jgi:hypothetical protein
MGGPCPFGIGPRPDHGVNLIAQRNTVVQRTSSLSPAIHLVSSTTPHRSVTQPFTFSGFPLREDITTGFIICPPEFFLFLFLHPTFPTRQYKKSKKSRSFDPRCPSSYLIRDYSTVYSLDVRVPLSSNPPIRLPQFRSSTTQGRASNSRTACWRISMLAFLRGFNPPLPQKGIYSSYLSPSYPS